jgi:hypothetical protein
MTQLFFRRSIAEQTQLPVDVGGSIEKEPALAIGAYRHR